MDDLDSRFHEEMIQLYEDAKRECDYNALRFLQMVSEMGGLQAAKALLHAEGFSDGFTRLWELDRLDLSMEARVLKEPWSALFTPEELETARKRLEELEYLPRETTKTPGQIDAGVVIFGDDDAGYLAWLDANPNGYVVNTTRPPSPGYLKLHVAACHTIRGEPTSGNTWTARDYVKVCAVKRSALETWAKEQLAGELDPCGTCFG